MNVRRIFQYLLAAIMLMNSYSLCAQKSKTGNWFIYFGNQAISKKWNWHNEVQYRNYNLVGDLQQMLLRTGIGFNLTENNNNILLGYAFIHTQKYLPLTNNKIGDNEHRIFQQYITRQNFKRIYLQHRYRIEERFLATAFQLRFRYFLGLNVPFNHKTMAKNTLYLSAYNEVFINGQSPVFDRNRLYGALGYVLGKNIRMEAGYMSQILEKSHRNQFQIVLFNNLPLHHK